MTDRRREPAMRCVIENKNFEAIEPKPIAVTEACRQDHRAARLAQEPVVRKRAELMLRVALAGASYLIPLV